MKKILAILMVLVMLGNYPGVSAAGVNKMPPDEETQEKQRENEAKQISKEEIAAMSVEEMERLELVPLNENVRAYAEYVVPCTAIWQSTSSYCGPASTLQALYTAGVYNEVDGDTEAAKQETLADQLGIVGTEGTVTANIPAVMDYYTNRTREWTSAMWTTYNTFWSVLYFMKANHSYGDAVIICLDTGALEYYEGYNTTHFVTGTGLYLNTGTLTDYENIEIRIHNPHNNIAYFGAHIVPAEQLRAAMSDFRSNHNFVY